MKALEIFFKGIMAAVWFIALLFALPFVIIQSLSSFLLTYHDRLTIFVLLFLVFHSLGLPGVV